MPTPIDTLTIAKRFCGPSASGNGGYVCGRLAAHIDGVATVRLKVPPPLDTLLRITRSGDAVFAMDGDTVVAEAKPDALDLTAPAPVPLDVATRAVERFRGFDHHSFPRCFVCGPHRQPGDGLRIFTGPVTPGDDSTVAAPWIVDVSLAEGDTVPAHFVWAALDCPSAFAVWPDDADTAIVLGQFTARIDDVPAVGEHCVAQAWRIDIDGRKRHAGSAIHGADGRLLGVAKATWIAVPASAFPADAA